MADRGANLKVPLHPNTQAQFPAIPRKTTLLSKQSQIVLQSSQKRKAWGALALKASSQSHSSKEEQEEIRVCISKTCSKSGSRETLRFLTGLAPPHVILKSCNCLGRCGSGPNLVVLPAELFVSHCNTAAHAAHLLAAQCGASDPEKNLVALSLKERGNKEFECGNTARAEQLYSQAIDLKPSGGQHFLYANRSAVRLAIGDTVGSLSDAKEASRISCNWHVAYLREGDAYYALGEYAAAENSYSRALAIEPSLRRSKSFKVQIKKLQEKLTLSCVSS